MMLEPQRKIVARYGQKMMKTGLAEGSAGNLSVMDPASRMVAVSPRHMEYENMSSADVAVVHPTGRVVEGGRHPTTELLFHLEIYGSRPDVKAVIHTHSVYATTCACLGWEIPAVHYLIGFAGKKIPLAPYAAVGSVDLAHHVGHALEKSNAALLANHGVVAVGPDMERAFATARAVEFVARIYYQARLAGEPRIISEGEMEKLADKFQEYGA